MKRLFRRCVTCRKRNQNYHLSTGWKSGYHSSCNKCRAKARKKNPTYLQQTARARKRSTLRARQFILQYLNQHPCVDCGNSNPVVLEFDHVAGKSKMISRMIVDGCCPATIAKELKKCEVRCACCHRIKTARTFRHFRFGAISGDAWAKKK